jgi:hypothetical protein
LRLERLRHSPVVLAGVYWGAIWGLYEATMGFVVHSFIRVPGASSVLLVPFALYCLRGAMRAGGGLRACGVAATTAAAVKLVDFCLPALTVLTVVNPAVAILFEGLAFVVVARQLGMPARVPSLKAVAVGALAFNAIWRVLFLLHYAVVGRVWSVGMMKDGPQVPLGFLLRDSLICTAVIVGLVALARQRRQASSRPLALPSLRGAVVVLALAVVAEIAGRLV